MRNIFLTGGAGYVGAVLVPKILRKGYRVTVFDLMLYGENVFDAVDNDPNLSIIKGDIRDSDLLRHSIKGHDCVIHLACISNDPSYELNPQLGKSINYDAFLNLVQVSKLNGVQRFIFASSSSVYGIKAETEVTENLPLEPLTDYSKYKALCEEVLLTEQSDEFNTVIIRPATVCGYSPRLRLDLTVNILTNYAINKGEITVFGGNQMRPNIHIEDMTDLYCHLLNLPDEKIAGQIYNAGYQNYKVQEIAEIVKSVIGKNVKITTTATNDTRSYHVSSQKIKKELGFIPRHKIEDAVQDLKNAFGEGLIPDSFEDSRYYNVQRMKEIELQ